MRLTHARVLTDDYQRSLAFYRDVLGLEVTLEAGDGIYAELAGGGSILALYRRDLMESVISGPLAGAGGVVLTFAVDDIDETFPR